VTKYIPSIADGIKYAAIETRGNNDYYCESGKCPKYHLGIALERNDNRVLSVDSDYNSFILNQLNGFNGSNDYCDSSILNNQQSNPDKCYDIIVQ
jgi:hypothetical protein